MTPRVKEVGATNPNSKTLEIGGLATVVMGFVTTAMYDHESPEARQRGHRARGGESAHETLVFGPPLEGVLLAVDRAIGVGPKPEVSST